MLNRNHPTMSLENYFVDTCEDMKDISYVCEKYSMLSTNYNEDSKFLDLSDTRTDSENEDEIRLISNNNLLTNISKKNYLASEKSDVKDESQQSLIFEDECFDSLSATESSMQICDNKGLSARFSNKNEFSRSKGKLLFLNVQELELIADNLANSIKEVSGDLVKLLQENDTLQQESDARNIAIEQLLKLRVTSAGIEVRPVQTSSSGDTETDHEWD